MSFTYWAWLSISGSFSFSFDLSVESYRATKLSESAKGGTEIMLLQKRLTDRFDRFRKNGEEIGPTNAVRNK